MKILIHAFDTLEDFESLPTHRHIYRIVALDSDVFETLSRTYPNVHSKLISWELIDPVGKSAEVYERSARQILEHIRELH